MSNAKKTFDTTIDRAMKQIDLYEQLEGQSFSPTASGVELSDLLRTAQ
jgi:hypothetical protein